MMNKFEELYLWRDPTLSGPLFSLVLIVCLSMNYYSLISVVSYTALFVLGTAAGVKVYLYVMKNLLKKDDVNDPIKKLADFDPTLPEDVVSSLSNQISTGFNSAVMELRRLFLIENVVDSIKFGAALWLLTYIGSWFNAMTLIIMAWVGVFTIPKIYLNNQKTLDPILDKVKIQLDDVKVKLGGFIPISSSKPIVSEEKKEE